MAGRIAAQPVPSRRPYDGPVYEELLNRDPGWALSEGSLFFEERGSVHEALRKITRRLDELGIPYALVGGMALFRHGYRRFTEDVGLLVTRDGLKAIHKNLAGLGYLPPFEGSKNLRDTQLGVKIEFLLAGDYPGDGKPKPVAFPDPEDVAVDLEGFKCLSLNKLIELKLASGMTSPDRLRDLADVVELIKLLNLPADLADALDPFVRPKFRELWSQSRKRYVTRWRIKWSTSGAKTIDDMIASLPEDAEYLAAMKNDGVVLDRDGGTTDDYVLLVTDDPEVAERYNMHEESEFWGEDDLDEDDGSPMNPTP